MCKQICLYFYYWNKIQITSKKILLALFDHYVLIYLERKNETVIDEVQNIITGDSDILKNSNDRFLVVTFVRKLLTSDTNEEDINIGKKQQWYEELWSKQMYTIEL